MATKCNLDIETLKQKKTPFLTPAEIAPFYGCTAQFIRVKAEEEQDLLGKVEHFPFPVKREGRLTRIERIPFIKWYEKATS